MSLFDENNAPISDPNAEQTPPSGQGELNAADQLLASITNDQGTQKYATVEEALKGMAHAQTHIATLTQEKADLTGQVLSQEQLQELLNARPSSEPAPAQPAASGLTAEDVASILDNRAAMSVADANVSTVEAAMAAQFGADAKTEIVKKVAEAGLTQDMADAMAKSSPAALLKLLGVEPTVAKPGMGSSFNSAHQPIVTPEVPVIMQQLSGGANPAIKAWRESVKSTNTRLGLN
jgi:hypothetical protein